MGNTRVLFTSLPTESLKPGALLDRIRMRYFVAKGLTGSGQWALYERASRRFIVNLWPICSNLP